MNDQRRAPGWGSFHSAPPYRANNPPGAPKISDSGSMLSKRRLGKEAPSVFMCQNCDEKPAVKQHTSCGHILCLDCLVDQGGECPLC